MNEEFTEAVRAAVRALGVGEVVSYGEIAAQAGRPRSARGVGRILRDSDGLPWWRVVTAGGRLAPGLEEEQGRRLAAEGVALRGGRVVRFAAAGRRRAGGASSRTRRSG